MLFHAHDITDRKSYNHPFSLEYFVNWLLAVSILFLPFCHAAEEDTITFAFVEQPPYVVIDKNGYPTGDYVKLAIDLAKKMEMIFEFWSCPFERCIELMKSAKADVMIGIEQHDEMNRYISFLELAVEPNEQFNAYFLKDKKPVSLNPKHFLEVKPRNLLRGAIYFHLKGNNIIHHKSIRAVTSTQYFELLAAERIDMIITSEKVGSYILNTLLAGKQLGYIPIKNFLPFATPMIGIARKSTLHQQIEDIRFHFQKLISESSRNRYSTYHSNKNAVVSELTFMGNPIYDIEFTATLWDESH